MTMSMVLDLQRCQRHCWDGGVTGTPRGGTGRQGDDAGRPALHFRRHRFPDTAAVSTVTTGATIPVRPDGANPAGATVAAPAADVLVHLAGPEPGMDGPGRRYDRG